MKYFQINIILEEYFIIKQECRPWEYHRSGMSPTLLFTLSYISEEIVPVADPAHIHCSVDLLFYSH